MRHVLLLILFSLGCSAAAQTLDATTTDGRKVVLHEDGTWAFAAVTAPADTALADGRSTTATELLRGARVPYGIWYDPSKWVRTDEVSNQDAEYGLQHIDGDVYVLVLPERLYIPPGTLREVAIANFKSSSTDFQGGDAEPLLVNDQSVFRMRMDGLVDGILPMTFYGQYYAHKDDGSVQLVVFTGTNLVDDYMDDFVELMNGFVILEDED